MEQQRHLSGLFNFRTACLISSASLEWAISSHFINGQHLVRSWSPNLTSAYEDFHLLLLKEKRAVPILTNVDFGDVKKMHDAICALNEQQSSILDVCELYAQSQAISIGTPFRALALFAVIESLLTHKPNPDDITDSLTRQIRGKLPLFARRFQEQFLMEDQFLPLTSKKQKVWDVLYSYRSSVAHGSKTDFSRGFANGGFSELTSSHHIIFVLNEFVRRLLKQAILEPDLCLDLKRC